MESSDVKLPDINERANSQTVKRKPSYTSLNGANARSVFAAKKERKE